MGLAIKIYKGGAIPIQDHGSFGLVSKGKCHEIRTLVFCTTNRKNEHNRIVLHSQSVTL